MYQRKNWTEEEDGTLLKLISQFQMKKWSQIAKTMESGFQMAGRTGKQCRQRWHNALNPAIRGENWSFKDSIRLFDYHSIYGNRWAKIASIFGDRSDNSVKNHFYSTLRKAHRIINKFIKQNRKKFPHRPIKDNVLSKIISLCEVRSTEKLNQFVQKAKNLLKKLVNIAQSLTEEYQISLMETVIKDLLDINKGFKLKKSTKRKRKPELEDDKLEVSQEDESQSSQKDVKESSQPSISSKHQQVAKQGFRLFNQTHPQNHKILDDKIKEAQDQFIPNFKGFYVVYNNQFQYIICQEPQIIQTGMSPLFYPTFWTSTI